MIELHKVTKAYGSVRAVQSLSLTIRRGEVVGLLGPNGAGKTTTMRMIMGFLRPDAGEIRVGGISVATDSLAVRAQIGYLPENAPLYHDMEVADFLAYVGRLRRLARAECQAQIREMVRTCGLRDVVGRPIGELSKGYRQRVGLAAALLHEPPILILDEPTSGLDPNQIQEIRAVIRQIGKERTVILSTHILQEVEAVCDRAFIVHRGVLVGKGSLSELMARSRNVRYRMLVDAAEATLRGQARKLANAQLVTCRADGGKWHEAIFEAGTNFGGEELFHWSVANGWTLRELRQETASLEEIFRELTTT